MRKSSALAVIICAALLTYQMTFNPSGETRLSSSTQPVSTLNYSSLIELLNSKQPRTVGETLTLIKHNYPSFLSKHTFVYQSLSLQSGDFQNPRALVFGDDAKLVLTFNGDPKQKGYDTLELMHFDDETKTFEFREIQFASEANSFTESKLPPGQVFSISPPNGKDGKCIQCHSDPVRPNWDTYPFWPGLYGSADDFKRISNSEIKDPFDRNEYKTYLLFMKSNRLSGRYGILPTSTLKRTNSELSHHFNDLNGQRIARQIKNDPVLYSRRKQILKAVLCEEKVFDTNQGYPSIDKWRRPKTHFEEQVIHAVETNQKERFQRYTQLFPTTKITEPVMFTSPSDVITTAKLIELTDGSGDIVGNWSLPTFAQSLDLNDGRTNDTRNSFKAFLLRPLIDEMFPHLKNTVAYQDQFQLDIYSNQDLQSFCTKF